MQKSPEEQFKKTRVTIKKKDQSQTIAREAAQNNPLLNPYHLLAMFHLSRFAFHNEQDDESYREGDEEEEEDGFGDLAFDLNDDYFRGGGTATNPISVDDDDVEEEESNPLSFFLQRSQPHPQSRPSSSSPEIIDLTSDNLHETSNNSNNSHKRSYSSSVNNLFIDDEDDKDQEDDDGERDNGDSQTPQSSNLDASEESTRKRRRVSYSLPSEVEILEL
jgi:hypothetical protein